MNYLYVFLISFAFYMLRYIVLAGAFHLFIYKLFFKYTYQFKLNKDIPSSKNYSTDFYWGCWTGLNYGLVLTLVYWLYIHDLTLIYFDIEQYGLTYLIASGFILFIIQDSYFFWFHYGFHKIAFLRKFSKHFVHHRTKNTSAWTAFSVHPNESFLELMFRPLILMILPLHPNVILVYLALSFILNVFGHSGYELLPSGYSRYPILKYFSSPTHHYLHHARPEYNFSLYLTWWDKVMGTEDPLYEEYFEKMASNNPIKLPQFGKGMLQS